MDMDIETLKLEEMCAVNKLIPLDTVNLHANLGRVVALVGDVMSSNPLLQALDETALFSPPTATRYGFAAGLFAKLMKRGGCDDKTPGYARALLGWLWIARLVDPAADVRKVVTELLLTHRVNTVGTFVALGPTSWPEVVRAAMAKELTKPCSSGFFEPTDIKDSGDFQLVNNQWNLQGEARMRTFVRVLATRMVEHDKDSTMDPLQRLRIEKKLLCGSVKRNADGSRKRQRPCADGDDEDTQNDDMDEGVGAPEPAPAPIPAPAPEPAPGPAPALAPAPVSVSVGPVSVTATSGVVLDRNVAEVMAFVHATLKDRSLIEKMGIMEFWRIHSKPEIDAQMFQIEEGLADAYKASLTRARG